MIRVWMVVLVAGLLSLPTAAAREPVAPKEVEQEPAATVAAEPEVALEFQNVWVRAMPPFQPNSAAYLTLINNGEAAVAIVGARSEVADKVELHTTRKIDGLMRMERLKGLAVAPGERVELAPGGTHLMLLGLAYRPVPGDDIWLCLQLASGAEACTAAEVRHGAEEQDHQSHH